jgi:glutamate-1-semialdehyde 2,1-aminomutase
MDDSSLKSGQLLWDRAKKVIPGGNQILSKRPEMFLPNLWPAYYSKAKGCEIWDLDGNHFYDFATMGVGTCALGYADDDINKDVQKAISEGSMGTLNSPEEVELAEKFIDLHPWSDMIRFSRTGGEACSIAIRIARAATGKDKVAFCGYHGWHDWYISSNIDDENNLNTQLLEGLDSKGVSRSLAGTAIPFFYNDIDSFMKVIEAHKDEMAAIFMEPVRGKEPDEGFLETIREISKKENIVLIFDEVTSGFRKNIGGIHLTYKVNPDIAVFGKALGNGFPISAVIGKKEVMSAAQETFISSTYWSERIGFVAALATIKKFEDNNVPQALIHYGKLINEGWKMASKEASIPIKISGLEPLTHIEFLGEKSSVIQTIYTQEMLKRGFLLGSSVYTTFAYNDEIIDNFITHTLEVFKDIKNAYNNNSIDDCLENEVKHSSFKRLT